MNKNKLLYKVPIQTVPALVRSFVLCCCWWLSSLLPSADRRAIRPRTPWFFLAILKHCKQEGLALSISPASLSAGQWAGPAQTKEPPRTESLLIVVHQPRPLISCAADGRTDAQTQMKLECWVFAFTKQRQLTSSLWLLGFKINITSGRIWTGIRAFD